MLREKQVYYDKGVDSHQESELNKCDLNDVLKECSDLICLISVGNEFHCLAPSIENDFEK